MERKIAWHCASGHDFEVSTELRLERCPLCGGTDIERKDIPSRWSRLFGDSKRNSQRKFWR
ncbi:MAG: hypothetical protein NT131_02680 [Methanomassiliicoccales archaeon]|nr:hypothetical protein [Methanomassiliicoccales archaeon]